MRELRVGYRKHAAPVHAGEDVVARARAVLRLVVCLDGESRHQRAMLRRERCSTLSVLPSSPHPMLREARRRQHTKAAVVVEEVPKPVLCCLPFCW